MGTINKSLFQDFEARKRLLLLIIMWSLPNSIFGLNLGLALLFLNGLLTPGLKARIEVVKQSKLLSWTATFFGLYALSALWSDYQADVGGALEVKSQLFSLPFIVMLNGGIDTTLREKLIQGFIAGCVIALMICVLGAFYYGFEEGWSSDLWIYMKLTRPIGIQPIYFSLYCVMGLFLAIRRLPADLRQVSKHWLFYCAMLLLVGVVLLSSRMEMLVMMAVGTAWLLYRATKEGWLGKALVLAIVGMMLLAGLVALSPTNRARFKEMLSINQSYKEDKWGGRAIRWEKWKATVEVASKHWLAGTGIGDMQQELDKQYLKNGLMPAYQFHFNPHNQYLQLFLVLGVPGFLLFIAFMIWLFKQTASYVAEQGYFNDFRLFLLVFYLSIITESMWERQWGLSFFLLFAALFLTQPKAVSTSVNESTKT